MEGQLLYAFLMYPELRKGLDRYVSSPAFLADVSSPELRYAMYPLQLTNRMASGAYAPLQLTNRMASGLRSSPELRFFAAFAVEVIVFLPYFKSLLLCLLVFPGC